MKRIFLEVFFLLIAAGATACVDAARGTNTPPASNDGWHRHEYSFVSMGFTSTYSCDGLADKLKVLLLAAGARADAKAQPGGCPSDFGHPDRLARADLVFYTLTPDGAGSWGPVVFTPNSPRELSLGDCELVEQFRAQVLPMFATRNLDDRSICVPHQDSGSVINLRFDAFKEAVHKNVSDYPAKRP